nr:hypothetical protein [Tanacetum cinerariifolium]
MRPFGCPVTILNTLDHLGKFKRKADEGFLVGYSVNRRGSEWLFDIDSLTISMNYEPVTAGNQTNHDADDNDADEIPGKGDKGVSKGSRVDDQERIYIKTDIFDDVYNDIEVGAEADTNNLELSTVMDVKSAFMYGTIEEEVYVCQPPSFEDPHFPNKKDDGIFISQDKYVADILKKFDFTTVKTASTPMKPNKTLIKDAEAKDVYVHLYRSKIRSLLYLIAFSPGIMFAVYTYDCHMKVNAATHKLTTAGEAPEEVGEIPTDTQDTPILTQPSSSQPQRKHKSKRKQRKETEGRIVEIDADEDLSLINETTQDQGRMNDENLFGVNDLDGDKVIVDVPAGENVEQVATIVEKEVSTAADEVVTTVESVEDITAATIP